MEDRKDSMRIKGVYERQLRARFIAILMLFGALFTLNGWGQADRGTISGTVVDPTGLAVSGVEISITESATGASYPGVITNDTGAYNIINLPLGKYSLLFQKQGFKQYNRNGITVSAAQQAKVDIKLQVGGSSETVTVTANATVVDSTTATEATSLQIGRAHV